MMYMLRKSKTGASSLLMMTTQADTRCKLTFCDVFKYFTGLSNNVWRQCSPFFVSSKTRVY